MDNSPLWHFDEEFCKWNMSNPNLKKEFHLFPFVAAVVDFQSVFGKGEVIAGCAVNDRPVSVTLCH